MNPKRTATLWLAGGLLALAVTLALAMTGVVAAPAPRHAVVVAGLAGAASAVLGERLHLQRAEFSR